MRLDQHRVLVVDDVMASRAILSRCLEHCGLDVVEADSGEAALDLLERQSFDLVLLDVIMPGLDGLEVLKRIRRSHTPESLPVMMTTAKAEGGDVVAALGLGANDYVTKPLDVPVALARVQSQLARKDVDDLMQQAKADLERHLSELEEANRRLEVEIDERKRSEARVHHLALHDGLTGLGNRLLFREEILRALARMERGQGQVALHCIDLDEFKAINDTLGHAVGDALLKGVAERLLSCVRETDVVVRLGGDEFAVIQTGVERPEECSALANRILTAVEKPFELESHQVVASCSVGIAIAPNDGSNPELLLASADMALYRAKGDGHGNSRFFEAEMNARAAARRLLERDLRQALTDAQFELCYQPLFDLASGRVTSFEALLRWRHPERGLLAPAEFLPVAEETGLIVPVGEWVLRQACAEAAGWPIDIRVAVNVSAAQFRGRNLAPTILNALASAGLAPGRLELEITESVLVEEDHRCLAVLHQLRRAGVRISMDDFGAGYLSLRNLRSFPFDRIKMDPQLVRDLSVQNGGVAVMRAVLNIASSLDMTATAEGVETETELEQLRAEGCVEVQGFFTGRPAPAHEALRMLADANGILRRSA